MPDAGADAFARARGGAATPGVGHTDLRHPAADHIFGSLPAIDPRDPSLSAPAGALVMPVSSGLRMPSYCRKPFPIWAVTCVEVAEIPSTWLSTAIGSPGTLALGIIGSVGSQPSHLRPLMGPAGAGNPGSQRSPGPGAPGPNRPSPPRVRELSRLERGLSLVTFGGQAVDLFSLFVELALGIGERDHRGILAGLRIGGGLVGLLLGRPRRRFLVHLLGPGPLQVGHHRLGTSGQGPGGRLGGDDVFGAAGGQIAARRTVHVGGRREGVEPVLGRGNRRVGVLDRLLADIEVVLRRDGVVPRGLHVDDRLVGTLLLGLDGRTQVIESLVGLGDVRDQCRHGVGAGVGCGEAG